MVHQPLGANHAETHPGLRNVLAAQNLIEVRDALAFIAKSDQQHFLGIVFYAELGPASAAILKRIARNLGDRGGDASLVLGLKFQGRGNGARLLPRQYHIILELDVDRKKIQGHGNYTNTTQSLPPKPLHHPARG